MARILVLDPYVPAPDRNSGGRRLFEILRLMRADGHNVTFMPQHPIPEGAQYLDAIRALGIDVKSKSPVVDEAQFRQWFSGETFDVVVISFYHLAQKFLPWCRSLFPKARIVIDTVDLHFVREERRASLLQDTTLLDQAARTRREELLTYAQADALWAITPSERDILLAECSVQDVAVVPNIHSVNPASMPFAQREGLLFVGNFWHPPNAEGIAWFCLEVLPILRERFPDLKTRVVGNEPPAFLQQFAHLGVELMGWVPELEPLLATSRVSIAPLLHGAGMKGKVGEALAAGLPCVTTSIGSEGMGLTHGENVLVADNPAAFASAITLAYSSEDLWRMLAVNGAAFMEAHYTPKAIQAALRDALSTAPCSYIAAPNWDDAVVIKSIIDGYVRKHSGSASSSLCLAVMNCDVNVAAERLIQWINELGHDVDSIPNIDLTPMTERDLAAVDSSMLWISAGSAVSKPAHLTSTEAFSPAAV